MNPHVSRDWFDTIPNPALINRLKEVANSAQSSGFEARFLAIGEALPPNQLMRFGLKDVRNYDSIELSRSFTSLKSLYNLKSRPSLINQVLVNNPDFSHRPIIRNLLIQE